MNQKDNIIESARKLGMIDGRINGRDSDTLSYIAEKLGMSSYNSLSNADTDELERKLKEYEKSQNQDNSGNNITHYVNNGPSGINSNNNQTNAENMEQKNINDKADNIKTAAELAATAAYGKLGGAAVRFAGRTKLGQNVFNKAGETLNSFENRIKHPLGIVNPQNSESNQKEETNDENKEPNNDLENNTPEEQPKQDNNKSLFNFFNKNKKDEPKNALDFIKNLSTKKKIYLILGLCSIALLGIIVIICVSPNLGAMLDLTEDYKIYSAGTSNGSNNNSQVQYTIEEIEKYSVFIGDSRFEAAGPGNPNGSNPYVGCQIGMPRVTYIAKIGQGYTWFVNTAIPQLDKVLSEDTSKKFVVINLGANGLEYNPSGVAKDYIKIFEELETKYPTINFYYMSVNRVADAKAARSGYGLRDNHVQQFNKVIQEELGNKYIDTYTPVSTIITSDGLHYDCNTYQKIHDVAVKYIQENTSAVGGSYTFLDEYPNGTENTQELNQPIKEVIGENGYNELNKSIEEAVNKAGKCTKTAAAAAGLTLAYNLYKEGYRLPYYWGGYHGGTHTGNFMGLHPDFGKKIGCPVLSAGGNCYPYFGFDCSGFTSWAMSQSLGKNVDALVDSFLTSWGREVSFSEAEPGDTLVKLGSHIRLVIENKGEYIQSLESTGTGLVFIKYTEADLKNTGYRIANMDPLFESNC